MTPEMGPLLRTLHKTVAPRHPCRWSSIQRRGRLQAPRVPARALPMTLRFWKCGAWNPGPLLTVIGDSGCERSSFEAASA